MRFRDETLGAKPVWVAYMWVPGLDTRGLAPLVQVAETRAKRAQLAGDKGIDLGFETALRAVTTSSAIRFCCAS